MRLWLESGNTWECWYCAESPIVCSCDQLSVVLEMTTDASESPHADITDLSSITSGSIRQKRKELKSSALSVVDGNIVSSRSGCNASNTLPSHLQYIHIYNTFTRAIPLQLQYMSSFGALFVFTQQFCQTWSEQWYICCWMATQCDAVSLAHSYQLPLPRLWSTAEIVCE